MIGDSGHFLPREDRAGAFKEVLGRDAAPRTETVLALDDPVPGACHLLRTRSSLVPPAVPFRQ